MRGLVRSILLESAKRLRRKTGIIYQLIGLNNKKEISELAGLNEHKARHNRLKNGGWAFMISSAVPPSPIGQRHTIHVR
jgi:hypothetical protein